MMDLAELYQDVILDHSRNPRNSGRLDPHTHSARGNNPLCGDRIDVYLSVEDGEVRDIRFEARGCAISVASASIMTEMVKGQGVGAAEGVFRRFRDIVTRPGEAEADELAGIDRLAALTGVRRFPMRVKCATLPWHAMSAALAAAGGEVTTE